MLHQALYIAILLPVELYGCKTWFLVFWEEYRFRVSVNRMQNRMFENGTQSRMLKMGCRVTYLRTGRRVTYLTMECRVECLE
jgi:hypothetical protein